MNIILVSNRLAKSRSISLGPWQIALFLMLLSVLMLGAAFTLQYALVRFAPEGLNDEIRTLLSKVQSDEQQKQQVYLRSSLDAMASRVGQMQAQLQRLDALGAKPGTSLRWGSFKREYEYERDRRYGQRQ